MGTRDGGCILYDRERVRISPAQFAHQSRPVGKMEPWPAAPLLAASLTPPAEQPDLSQLTERGAVAWAGVDAQALRDGTHQPAPAPAELEQLKGRISRIGLDIDRALHGQVNEQSPVGAGRLAAIAALAKPAPAPLSDDTKDAARWRETLMHIGAANHLGGQHFTLNTLRISDQMFLLRGSVSQHFTKCIDESIDRRVALAAQGVTP